jgi:Zn-dependent protease
LTEFSEPEQTGQTDGFQAEFPPKPVLVEKQENVVRRSLISLLVYALLFYFFFDQNIAYIAAILLVIIVHEMGHFFAMRIFHYSNVKIFIVPLLGAYTSGKKQQVSQKQLSAIILAGPIPGIIVGCVLMWLNHGVDNETLKMLAYSFLFINILNLLPFFPLDGGRLVETLFFKDNYTIRLVFGIISIIGLSFFFLFTSSFILLIVPVMIALELRNESRHEKIREYLRQEKVNYFTEYPALPDKDYWIIRDCLLFAFPKKYAGMQPGQHAYSVFEPVLVQHVESVLKVNLRFDMKVIPLLLTILLYLAAILVPIFLYIMYRH